MGQETMIYSFVARGAVVLAEYTEFSGNFNTIASKCLQKLPASNNRFSYNCDNYTFNYLVEDGFSFCLVVTKSAGRELPVVFLDRIKDEFNERYGGGKAATAKPNSLNKEFGPQLKVHMKYFVDHPEEVSKIGEVKGVMMENIDKVLDRDEKIELLINKTENLRSHAQDFKQQGIHIKRKMWYQNMKIKLVVVVTFIVLDLIIFFSVCHGDKSR